MTQTLPKVSRRPQAHRLLLVPFVLLLGLSSVIGWMMASSSTTDLISGCLEEGGFLSPTVVCTYLEVLRNPNPNEHDPEPSLVASPASAHPQTIFGSTLAGYDSTNPRAVALVDHFIDQGVDWGKPHDVGLTPLHMAVLYNDETLTERFLAAGASPTERANDPGRPYHGKSVLEFLAWLRRGGEAEHAPSAKAVAALNRIEMLLTTN